MDEITENNVTVEKSETSNAERDESKNRSIETTVVEIKKKKERKFDGRIIFYSLLTVAVIVLYLLYFLKPLSKSNVVFKESTPGTGEMLYVNVDSISKHYELIKILNEDIEAEIAKQTTLFENKEKAFEKKYNQFQKNYEAGILTEMQVQLTSNQLQEEYQTIIQQKQQVLSHLEERQMIALTQVSDSIRKVSHLINMQLYNASYIFAYQDGAQILYGDPTKDITQEVLEELNKRYKK